MPGNWTRAIGTATRMAARQRSLPALAWQRAFPYGIRAGSSVPKDPEVRKERELFNEVFEGNREFVARKTASDPAWFSRMADAPQAPRYLFIGCSDSRVNANEITGLEAGQLFVHRNIANLVVGTDLNLLSVLQYSVEVLRVKHIIVCGHYGCGGVKAAMQRKDIGLIENWLRNIRDVQRLHKAKLDAIDDEEARYRRVVELNVEEQCLNLFKTGIVQSSIRKHKFPWIHGLVYDLHDGILHELDIDFRGYHNRYSGIYSLHEDDAAGGNGPPPPAPATNEQP
eukprot:jgi/Mesvir1/21353/Mv20842-RA.1